MGDGTGVLYEIPPERVLDVIAAVKHEIERVKNRMSKYPKSSGEYTGLADYLPVVEQDLADLHTQVESLTPDEKTTTWIKAPQRHWRQGPSKDINGFLWFRTVDADCIIWSCLEPL